MHLISPTNFRLGKTIPWKSNVVLNRREGQIALGGNLSTSIGFEKAISVLLQSYNLFIIRGVIRYSIVTNVTSLNLLYAPRMREDAQRYHDTSTDSVKEWLYSSREPGWTGHNKIYSHFRKIHKKTVQFTALPKPKLNKWISIRMFRGAKLKAWRKFKIRLKRPYKIRITIKATLRKRGFLIYKKFKTYKLNRRRNYMKPLPRYTYNSLQLNNYQLTKDFSILTRQKIKVKIINVFAYLVKKGILIYKNHQTHFWNQNYRARRWGFTNYWDVVNAFYLIGTIQHTEHFLLELLREMLPRVVKIRRAFYFLDIVIKNLPQIIKRFNCFRMTITGKLAGGTKRTRHFTIGYGRLAVNSLSEEAYTNFNCFAHRFGAFGIGLLMCKNSTKTNLSYTYK